MTTVAEATEAGHELRRRCEEVCDNVGARLLVLGPLAAAYLSDENSRALVRAFMTDLSVWADARNCAVMLVAHPPKSEYKTSGSSDWHAASRAVWFLEKETIEIKDSKKRKQKAKGEARWKLTCEKSNYAPRPDDLMLDWDKAGGALRWQVLGKWRQQAAILSKQAENGEIDDYEDAEENNARI